METIYKTYRAEIKEVNEEDGIIDMLIPLSTGSMDRDGEIIEPNAFKKSLPNFKKRPVLVSSHNYGDLRKVLGEWKKIKITENGLEGSPQYYINQGNEEADWAFNLASKGMAAFSVAFIPKDFVEGNGEDEPKRTYKEGELLEISQVVVPSNREAIQSVRAKSVDPIFTEICDKALLITKPEETDEYIRIPAPGESGKHDGHRIRTINISEKEGIKALYCGECKVVITYLFAKDHDWTMERAQGWVKEHSKSALIEITQAEIADELDYIVKLIESKGMNDEVKIDAWKLVGEVMRLSGNDIPVSILAKIGAVLNQKNKGKLKDAQTLIQEVLDSAEPEPASPKSDDFSSDDLKSAIKEVFSKYGG